MTAAMDQVCKEALALPLDERMELVRRILEQSDVGMDSEMAQREWDGVVRERMARYDAGQAKSRPAEDGISQYTMNGSGKETTMQAVKESARQVIEGMSDRCTWDDLLYELYVRQKIDQGLDDLENGRVVSHEEVRRMMVRP